MPAEVSRATYFQGSLAPLTVRVSVRGAARMQPLGEINARMTMGLVARALAERILAEELRAGRGARLRVGARHTPAGMPLLFPGEGDTTSATLEVL